MDKDQLIREILELIERKECIYFVGSGISRDSGIPTWKELLDPLCSSIGITSCNGDSLPMIAQYIINSCIGNRTIITNYMKNELSGKKVNRNHISIANTLLSTIWTTNYDCLLEDAFNRKIDIRVEDYDLLYNHARSDTEIMKLHGCIEKSAPDRLVITQSDYDDIEINRQAMLSRLTIDLMNKSFLFIGYGMNDPDIRAALVLARRLGGKSCTRTHYMILKELEKDDGESEDSFSRKKEMYNHWLNDLRRYGIMTLLISRHEQVCFLILDS